MFCPIGKLNIDWKLVCNSNKRIWIIHILDLLFLRGSLPQFISRTLHRHPVNDGFISGDLPFVPLWHYTLFTFGIYSVNICYNKTEYS